MRTPGSDALTATAGEGAFLDAVARLITARTGLLFPPNRRGLLERALATWLEGADPDPSTGDALTRQLDPNGSSWRRLLSLVTVGETSFFRHPEQLEALRSRVLPDLIRRNARADRPAIRVWSAGSATGEEAYSLAILLSEAVPDPARWDLRVVGTDIDAEALDRARAGVYRIWAFRVPGGYRTRWFQRVAGGERVDERIRALVTFEEHNLADAVSRLPAALDRPPDLIVCRNVMMYMSEATNREIVERFRRALSPGGWLMVGPVESPARLYASFVAEQVDGYTFYRRSAREAEVTPRRAPTHARLSSTPPASAAGPAQQTGGPLTKAGRAPGVRAAARPGPAFHGHSILADAGGLADAGRLEEADARCREAIARNRLDPAGYRLLATIAEGRDDLEGACHALGRVLFLQPEDSVASFRLALIEWRRGRIGSARRRMRAVLSIIEGLPDDALLDEAVNLSVAHVRAVGRSVVETA